VRIEIEGLGRDARLRSRITTRLEKALERLPAATSALVTFTDVNGPKGGVDRRCGVTVSLPARPTVHVEHLATTPALAFDAAADALDRTLKRQRERAETRRRRPKKYFLAKRLLTPEPAAGAAPARRRRNPRSARP
jgi:putative sigma-54 modulation protein